MNWLEFQMAIMNVAANAMQFAVNWLIQSTLLIAIGLLLARLLQKNGSAAQSLVYRTTLTAVLIVPIVTTALGGAGVTGWSLTIEPGYSLQEASLAKAYAANQQFLRDPAAIDSGSDVTTQFAGDDVHPTTTSTMAVEASANALPLGTGKSASSMEQSGQTTVLASQLWVLDISLFGLLSTAVMGVWLIVSLLLLSRLSGAWWRMSRLVSTAHRADQETVDLCERLASQLCVKRPNLLRSPFISSPCLAGLGMMRRANIVLTADDVDLPIRDVLVHELAHLRRRDCHWNLLRQIATSVYFFQPLIWMISRRIEITAEEVCDDVVVHSGGDRHQYAHRLVDIAELSTELSSAAVAVAGVGIVSLRSMLARRVDRILDTSRSLSTRVENLLMVAVLSVGFAGTLAVGFVGLRQTEISADEPLDDPNVIGAKVVLPNGRPASNAHVALIGLDRKKGEVVAFAESTTDENGKCRLTSGVASFFDNSSDPRTIIARLDGYGIGWERLSTKQASGVDVQVQLNEQEIIPGKLIDIEGQPAIGEMLQIQIVTETKSQPSTSKTSVFLQHSGNRPVSLAWVQPVTSGKDGRFRLMGVPKNHGVYMTLLNSERFPPQDISLNTGQSETRGERDQTYRALVKNSNPGEEAVLTLPPAKVLSGTITYEDTGEPVADAKIGIWASQQKFGSMYSVYGKTDAEGKYRMIPKPGIRFGVTAYPPAGRPYMARAAEQVDWKNSDLQREVNIKLPRVTLVRGKILEEGTNKPVEDASVTFEFGDKSDKIPSGAITGWQTEQKSDANGNFTFAVPPGRGTLMVKKRNANYVLKHRMSRQIRYGLPGGSRVYAHALKLIEPKSDEDSIDVEIRLTPGEKASGEIVDQEGNLVDEVHVISNLKVWDGSGRWRSDSRPNIGGKFELIGLEADRDYPVYFLDAKRKLGATVNVRGGDADLKIKLKPCGAARAKFVLDDPDRRFSPTLIFVATPGVDEDDLMKTRMGLPAADSDFNSNIDGINYRKPLPKDADGYLTFPALIPGATYRLLTYETGSRDYKEFTAKSGETLELGVFKRKRN